MFTNVAFCYILLSNMENEVISGYKAELDKNGVVGFVPGGNSMWPTLKNRKQSIIVLSKTERLKPLDVALYMRADGSYVLHRVMNVTDTGYIMCGDSQFSLESVPEERVIGCMAGFYRGKKYVEVTDEKYIKKVKLWYKRKTLRKIRLKFFYLRLRVKNLIKKIFQRKTKKGE